MESTEEYERFYGDALQDEYHSDSAIPQRQALARNDQGFESSLEIAARRKEGNNVMAKKTSAPIPHAPGKKDRATLRAAGAAREKKARRKNIARRHRDEEEIRLFRGGVSCVCTCMELDTEKLLPALQQHFEQEQEEGQDQDASHPHSQDENKMGGGDDKPGVRAQGAGNWRSSKEKGDSSEDDASKSKRRNAGNNTSQQAGQGSYASQKPLRSCIKGSWTFSMYVDVLHCTSVFPRDDMVNAARAELLERRSSHAPPGALQRMNSDELLGGAPTIGVSSHAPGATAQGAIAQGTMGNTGGLSIPKPILSMLPAGPVVDVKQILAHVAANATNSPSPKPSPKPARQSTHARDSPADPPRDSRTTTTGEGLEAEQEKSSLAAGYTVVKAESNVKAGSRKSPTLAPKSRVIRPSRSRALDPRPLEEIDHEDMVGESEASDDELTRGNGSMRRQASRHSLRGDAGHSDVEGGQGHAYPASLYVDHDGYEPDHFFGAPASDEPFASSDPLLDEFEAEIQRAAATVSDLATKHVFCFQYGCMVFWGLEQEEQEWFIRFVQDCEEESILEDEHERDDMTFFYSPPGTSQPTRVYNDQVCLSSNSPLEKLSVSFSLAQSTKLMVLETRVENTFEKTRAYPQELAETGHISLSQSDVSKLIGQLFIVKSSVNLESDMLSTPDFFWDNEVWEPIFRHACKYLEIDDRVIVVNKRLEVLDGMFQMLKDQLEVRHATRLEWIVIWLIVAEVGLEVVWNILIKDILGFFHDSC
mmetsp:Transcript_41118/g.66217  ORF Transcript_41118/g.66217 Transcript_41118/m.66217 type:complete len:761 (+) Transcript_41118:188-2470(+)|eukprot:CAMPEP_0179416442 /NCGR_PEP_ID=MMETSP0799-20121207/6801_1 /TAXON_ID=46947 /ORGANISM="Geminigera cryophila, Strain CCMP2564" /LENGTH=760 /DNA_ID=CAMNT_0021189315 /DNA_START=128 /DNA_END=2410 /DNA_ORIENTATION=+